MSGRQGRRGGLAGVALAAAVACAGGGSGADATTSPSAGVQSQPDGGATPAPPVTRDGWTFYGRSQGLSDDPSDAAPDEGGNVYVAGGDALHAKRRGDGAFLRFDAANAGLTRNCNDPAQIKNPNPPAPFSTCPVITVAGAAAGKALVGFQGVGTDGDSDAEWAMDSSGVDVVAFDGAKLTRTRHVLVASPPHTICVTTTCDATGKVCTSFETHAGTCAPDEFTWSRGRRKGRQIFRIAVNHEVGRPEYGDAWLGGTHITLAAVLNEPGKRGFVDRTAGQPARWADAKDVWEHEHPAVSGSHGEFLTGYTHAVAVEPRSGVPWGHNGFRLARIEGYGNGFMSPDQVWWLPLPWLDLWPDDRLPAESLPAMDAVESLSFCDDGTLWMGSSGHGLARRAASGGRIDYFPLPDGTGDNVWAVACDPSDGTVWVGLGWGGVMRFDPRAPGTFTQPFGLAAPIPPFWWQPVRSIQIDRWASPRIVYFAHVASRDAAGKVTHGGGVSAYAGP